MGEVETWRHGNEGMEAVLVVKTPTEAWYLC